MLSRALACSGALIAGALVAVGAFGCGGNERNASATTEATPVHAGGATETTTTADTTATETTPTQTATVMTPAMTSTPAATTPTRTETAPASGGAGGGLAGATATLNRQGYSVPSTATYRPGATLRVLVGVRQGAGDGKAQKAFFFVGDRFLGTDTADPSAQVSVVAQDDTSVTLRYALYRRRDGSCCPSGGHADVRFALDQGRLAPTGDIPPADPGAALSRR